MNLHSRRKFGLVTCAAFFLWGCINSLKGAKKPDGKGKKIEPTKGPDDGTKSTIVDPVAAEGSEIAKVSDKLKGLIVTLDVGHAFKGQDGPAVSGSINEHVQVRLQSTIVKDFLTSHGATVRVKIYESATLAELDDRGRAAAGSHVLVSLHHNAFSDVNTQGSETLFDSRRKKSADQKLAGFIQKRVTSVIWGPNPNTSGQKRDRGVKDQKLSVMNNTPATVDACCTVEPYFITGTDAKTNFDKWSRDSATAVAEGIMDWHLQKTGSSLSLTEDEPLYPVSPPDDIDSILYANH